MGYLLMHIWLCLLAAALLGGLLMWLVSKLMNKNVREEIEGVWTGRLRDAEARAGALGADLIRVEGKIPGLEGQIGDWKTKFAALEGERGKLAAGLVAAEGKVPGLEAQIGEWKTKFAGLEGEKTNLVARLASTEGKLPGLEAQIGDWKAKFAALEGEKSGLAGKLSSLVSEHQTGIAAAAAAAATAGVAATAKFHALENEKREVEARLEQSRKVHLEKIASHEVHIAGFTAQVAELTQERDQFQARLDALSGELAGSKNALTAAAQANHAVSVELADARNQIVAAEHSATQHSLQLQQVAQERDQHSGRYRILNDELALAKTQLAELTSARQAAPLAMAAAVGAASSVVAPADDWQPRYHELDQRFRGFVIGQQKEGYGDIERIEGIGPVFGQKLRQAGIAWVKTLLAEGGSSAGRKAIIENTGLDAGNILTWVNAADLLRIEGVTPDWAEMLEVAGVDTVKELRNRVPENLHKKLVETRAEKARQFHSDAPDLEVVRGWINAAKTMEPAVTH